MARSPVPALDLLALDVLARNALIIIAGALAASSAVAGPTVVVVPFTGKGSVPEAVLGAATDDVRSALVATVAAHGGIVMTSATMAAVAYPKAPAACTTAAQCDLAYARALHADLLVTGDAALLDGATSISLQVIGTTSGNLLAGKRVQAAKSAELLRTTAETAALLLDEVFDRFGPGKAGATSAAEPKRVAAEPDDDSVVQYQGANLFRGAEAVGGHVTVTRRTVRFEAHALNLQGGAESFLIADVVGMQRVDTLFVPNGVVVRLRNGVEKRFVLEDRERFMQAIEDNRPGG